MKRLFLAVAVLIGTFGQAVADNGLITKPSKYSVVETMDRLESLMKTIPGAQIFARIDFQALTGGKIRPNQLLIFGNGALIPGFVASSSTVTIDLPIKVLIWEDNGGKVWASYNSGEFLRDRHGLKDAEKVVNAFTAGAQSRVEKALE